MITLIKDKPSKVVLVATMGKVVDVDGVWLDGDIKTGIPTSTTELDTCESLPEYFTGGIWAYDGHWFVYDKTGYELHMNNIKESLIVQIDNTRKKLLQDSDWTQLPDVNLSNKQAWADYRQELRDIPLQPDYPFKVDYPKEPVKPLASQPVVSGMQEV